MKLAQLETPALIADLDVMERNMAAMDKRLEGTPLKLRPHYKSHKCPAIAHMQMARGAKGITCAKLSEAETLVLSGIPDVLIANQVTVPSKISRLAYLASCCRMTVCVDDPENIRALEAACALEGSLLHIYVEYDIGMKRCGARTKEEFLALTREVLACPHLSFDGIQAYAGNLAHEECFETRRDESAKVEEVLRELIGYLKDNGITVKEVSGISTGTIQFHDLKDTVYTEVQAGSYLFLDEAYEAVGAPFEHALFVLSTVISKPQGALITDAGLKSVSVDQRPPRFAGYEDCPVEMSEEHVGIYTDAAEKVGDKLKLIPSHCCTTINLYDWLYLVRGNEVTDRIPIVGRGKSL